jgi:hypothetical protein
VVCSHPCNPFPQILAAKESFWTCSSQFSCSQFFPTEDCWRLSRVFCHVFLAILGHEIPKFSPPSRTWPVVSDWSMLRERPVGSPCAHPVDPTKGPRLEVGWEKNNSPYMTYTIVNNHKNTIWLSMIKRYNYHIHILYIYIQSCFCEFQDISSNHLARKTPSSLNKPLFMIVYV